MKFKLLVAIVKPECTDNVVEAARKAGATGDVIINARGSGSKESRSFFGLTIEDQIEVILFIVAEHCVKKIMNAISEEAKFDQPGGGICFSLNLEEISGIESQIELFKNT
ncbi:MAG: P-II family nitrogen regulator [Cryomorphaceae bacterium]|nr:P-II family nitrogen regulator [Cryomorphaceae bacterium]